MSESSNSEEVSLDTAYTKLEGVIRNFSREKMLLDDHIKSLNRQVELAEDRLTESNKNLTILTVERDKLKHIHDEDEKARYAVEAMVTSCEQKIQVLADTLQCFQDELENMSSRSGSRDEFNQMVKKVQLALGRKIREEVKRHSEVIKKYKDEVERLAQDSRSRESELLAQLKSVVEQESRQRNEINELVVQCNSLKSNLAHEKEASKESLDSMTRDLADKSGVIERLAKEKQLIENQLVNQMKVTKEKEIELQNTVNDLAVKCKSLESTLAHEKEASKDLMEFQSKAITEKSGVIEQLEKDKQQIESQLHTLTMMTKEKEDELQNTVNELVAKCKSLESNLALEKVTSKELVESQSKAITEKSGVIEQLEKAKQQIDSQLHTLTMMTKEKEDELQDTVNELVAKCKSLESDLALEKVTSKELVESQSKEIAEKSGVIEQLEKEKQQIDNQLNTLTMMTKQKEEELRETLNELVVKCKSLESSLAHEKETSTELVDSMRRELADNSGIIEHLGKEKQHIENQLHTQMMATKEKEDELQDLVNELVAKCKCLESNLALEKETSRELVEFQSADIAEKSGVIKQLEKEKQQIENQLLSQTISVKEKEDELQDTVNELAAKCKSLESTLDHEKETSKELVESMRRELADKSEKIEQLVKDKQQIENQLVTQMRVTKEKENELQDTVKQNTKQIQIIRSGYEDLSAMLDITKNEKSSLAESYSKLQEDKRQMELHLNEEINSKKNKAEELQEELESLRFVQKRYVDLKKHLSSLMKEKPTKEFSTSFSSLKLTEEKNSSRSNYPQEEKSTKVPEDPETPTPRPSSRRSYPPTTPGRSPKGILKNQADAGDKKNVSFGNPLSYSLVSSCSDSSPEAVLNPDSQVQKLPTTTASTAQKQKRPSETKLSDKKDMGAPNDKKAKPSESTDLGNGRKFFRKKTIPSPSPFKVYK